MQEGPLSAEQYETKLKEKDEELQDLKTKVTSLENEVIQAGKLKNQRSKEQQEVAALKEQSEGILTKAKAMIFENTKIIKNQELQIEALGQQNESLKDVIQITKDLLEIRNLEVKQLEIKINTMESKVKAEKERQDLMHKKLENMIRHNGELKREYEAQLCLFSALRERYNERELAKDVVDNLKEEVKTVKAEQQEKSDKESKPEQEARPEIENKSENEEKSDKETKVEQEVKPEKENKPENEEKQDRENQPEESKPESEQQTQSPSDNKNSEKQPEVSPEIQ